MTIEKTFGFTQSSPYRSETFNKFSRLIFGRNGLIKPPTDFVTDWVNRRLTIVGGITFLQSGLVVTQTDPTIVVDIPAGLEAPFYLVGTTPDNIVRNNIVYTFAKTPQELSTNHVVLANYDGVEWRLPDLLDVDGIVKHREYSNVVYGHPGFNRGLNFSHNQAYTQYTLSGGDITDKQGYLTTLMESRNFDALTADPDYSRIDTILYRRPDDHYNRMGYFQLLAGLTMSSRTSQLHTQTLGQLSTTNAAPRILINKTNNKAYVFWSSGMTLSADTLYYACLSADRTTIEVGPTPVISDMSLGMYDVSIDHNGDIAVVYVSGATSNMGGDLKFTKLAAATGMVLISPTQIESDTVPYFSPRVITDRLGIHHIFVHASISTTEVSVRYVKINENGAILIPFRELMLGTTVTSFSVAADPEFHTHLAYAKVSDGSVHYAEVDSDGQVVTDSDIVVNQGEDPQVFVTDNKEVYVSFTQSKRLYFWRYQKNSLTPSLQDYPGGLVRRDPYMLDNVVFHRCAVDTHNNMHVLYADGTGLYEMTILLPTNEGRAEPILVSANWIGYDPTSVDVLNGLNVPLCDIVLDAWGSVYWADGHFADTFTNIGTTVSVDYFGPGIYGTEANALSNNEFAIKETDFNAQYLSGKGLTVGDSLTITGSSYDGVYYLTSKRTTVFNGVNYVALSVHGQTFSSTGTGILQAAVRDDSRVYLAKLAPLTSYDFPDVFSRELETDQIYALIKRPSNEIILWNSVERVPASGFLRHDSTFLTSAGIISLDTNLLTWASPLILKDPMRYQLTIPSGTIDIQNDEVLFTYLPKITDFAGDGDAEGVNQTMLKDVVGLVPGMQVFVGDSDSPGIECTITGITDRVITTDISLSNYRVERGAYVVPTSGSIVKETRNSGVLRPASDGTIDQDIFVIAYRTNDLVYFRNGALTLQDKEEGWLGEGPGEDVLTYIGATSETDKDPFYSWNYGGTQGENLTSRLGAVDLRAYEAAQDRNVFDLRSTTLEFSWDAATETLTWSGDEWRVQVANVGSTILHTIATGTKAIANLQDNQVAYVTINRTSGAGDLTPVICASGAVPLDKDNRANFVIAKRIGSVVYVGRFAPLTLDTTAASLAQQADKNFKLIGGGSWTWSGSVLTWTADALIRHIGLPENRNVIAAGSDSRLVNDGDILYVDLNRKTGAATSLTVNYGNVATVAKAPHRVIFAERKGSYVYVGNMQLEVGVTSLLERPYSQQAQTFIGQPTPSTTTHNYGNNVFLQTWMSHEVALAELDGRISQFFGTYPSIAPYKFWVWIADGLTDTLNIGDVIGYGDNTIQWAADHTMKDIIVYREGLKMQQSYDGIWPIVNDRWDFVKVDINTLRFKETPLAGEKFLVIPTTIATAIPPAEYVWLGDGITTDFDISTALEIPPLPLPFNPSNGNNDIMVWVEQFRHYQSTDSAYPIPDNDQIHHDFYKLNSTTIRFQEAPRLGEAVVLRAGSLLSEMWADMIWYGDGLNDTFTAGENAYGNPFVRWSANTDVNDIAVEVDGIFMEPNVDFVKTNVNVIQFTETPVPGAKIVVHGLNLLLIQNKLDVYYNGNLMENSVTKIDFRGSGVVVSSPAVGEVRVTVTGGGGGGASFTTTKYNGSGVDIPKGRAVYFGANNGIYLADNTIVGMQNPVAITIEDIANGFSGLVQFGGLIEGVIDGLGFNWGDEVFLGLNGELVKEADIPDTASPMDIVLKIADVAGTDALPTDIIWAKEQVGGF